MPDRLAIDGIPMMSTEEMQRLKKSVESVSPPPPPPKKAAKRAPTPLPPTTVGPNVRAMLAARDGKGNK